MVNPNSDLDDRFSDTISKLKALAAKYGIEVPEPDWPRCCCEALLGDCATCVCEDPKCEFKPENAE